LLSGVLFAELVLVEDEAPVFLFAVSVPAPVVVVDVVVEDVSLVLDVLPLLLHEHRRATSEQTVNDA